MKNPKLTRRISIRDNISCTILIFFMLWGINYVWNLNSISPIVDFANKFSVSAFTFSQLTNYEDIKPDTNIVIVNIGKLERDGIARQISIINKYKPSVIAVDALFPKKKADSIDQPLKQAFSEVENLVLGSNLIFEENEPRGFEESIPIFTENSMPGYVEIQERERGLVEGFITNIFVDDIRYLPFSLTVLEFYKPECVENYLISKDNLEQDFINFRRRADKYKVLDVDDVLQQRVSLEFIKGKIVILGYLGSEVTADKVFSLDNFYTSMNEFYLGNSLPDMHGVIGHANIMSMLIDGEFLSSTNALFKPFRYLLVALLTYLNMAFFMFIMNRRSDSYIGIIFKTVLLEFLLFFVLSVISILWLKFIIEIPALWIMILLSGIIFVSYHESIKIFIVKFFRG